MAKPEKQKVVYKLRDISMKLVKAWEGEFIKYRGDGIEISCGDIFKGAPSADAIVSPANSFGFMDGGIDRVYSLHFGWQMQERLQKVLREEYHGELMVGNVVIIPAYAEGNPPSHENYRDYNGGQPIKWLISAPTMRVPLDVSDTANAYLAFRAVILAVHLLMVGGFFPVLRFPSLITTKLVQRHNADPSKEPIKSVLCPGLGTAVGNMDPNICSTQMINAYETFELKLKETLVRTHPESLWHVYDDHDKMTIQPLRKIDKTGSQKTKCI